MLSLDHSLGVWETRLPILCALIVVLTLVVSLAVGAYRLAFHPLRRYPGPWIAALSDLPYLYWTWAGTLQFKIKDFHDRYGEVIRIGPNSLTYRSPQVWREIYGTQRRFPKDPSFYVPTPSGPTIVGANDADHSRIRRLLVNSFADKALREQEALIHAHVDLLMETLRAEVSASRQTVDMAQWFEFVTFDITGDLAFGESFDCVKSKQYHPWVSIVYPSMKSAEFERSLLVYPVLTPLVKLLLPRRLVQMRRDHWHMSNEKLQRRLATQTDRKDFLTYILRHNDERGMSHSEIEANAGILIIAGSQTTSTLLSGCIFHLFQNPAAYRRLTEEIRGGFECADQITFQSVAKLPYLCAVIEETLRVYPPVPAIFPRLVPTGGAVLNGEHVPEGVSVSVAHYSTYRSRTNFAEPDSFLPERWLDEEDPGWNTKFAADRREALQPFSYGSRNCIGQRLAYAQARTILAKFLWNFDVSLDPQSLAWTDQLSFSIWERLPLIVRLTTVSRDQPEIS
ncbi:benzoate 4-monooxygenase cytochrome P450 [Aspergillus heteromorphus CBS 117.55]|uniref:Benzoate 4-monooxygenase cytochrome P450 n=1 Tax=Aspergillus heteromorphus CBS 117.55 TaxID=1448321 RepID=A0A317WPV9_9EURO|nr:benzoate 4-monooxygenase cytochrome P450 [Aspergillus heteromorphus CBS 117.55]PWY88534.1 benzoate 4-monooxygenase cytochrome P450 [Aspergillus heteromorphus CBS 117.55]